MSAESGIVEARRFDGKVILVTGGASGIGAGVVANLRERGAQVVAADIAVAADSDSLQLDVTDQAAWQDAVAKIIARFGRIDGLVHAAGILRGTALLDFDKNDFVHVLKTNLTGTFLAIKHVGPAIANSGGGAIVTLSSVEGLHGSNSMAAYGSSKWAVRGLTKVAAIELGDAGVRVNSIHPGPINTPMLNPAARSEQEVMQLSMFAKMAISRVGAVSEVAAMCAYLLSDEASFVTGAEFVIDGGLTAGSRRAAPAVSAA